MTKYIIRLDDIAPHMGWEKFDAFKAVAYELGIKPIVAVIPFNKDRSIIDNYPLYPDLQK